MAAYYNEFEPYAAQWLRNLIAKGLIADGEVDGRSILDVRADDLEGFRQCHFFAGIGVWSHALRLAGWEDDREVWTGSCPCQPLSSAGKQLGHADERHVWPAFYSLVAKRKPSVVFGEQVASKDGREWFAAVRADLEGLGYALGGADLCGASVGAPHIRQRIFFVAEGLDNATSSRHNGALGGAESEAWDEARLRLPSAGDGADGLADNEDGGCNSGAGLRDSGSGKQRGPIVADCGGAGGLADDDGRQQRQAGAIQSSGQLGFQPQDRSSLRKGNRGIGDNSRSGLVRPGARDEFWRAADWLFCRDGKWRPVEPGTSPLAHGASSRVGRLRAYGNAIIPQVAAEMISAFMECRP